MRSFTRFVVSGVCLLGVGGDAGAESAREFWQSEWQRQQPRVSSLTPSWQGGGAFREQGERFDGQKPFDYSGRPEERSLRVGNLRPSRGKMPTVRVSNPDFLTYVPDKLTNVALGSVCEFKTASNGGPAGDNKPQDSGASDVTATPALDSSPASAFAQACAVSPAISMRLMPQVGEAIARHYSKHPQFIWSDQRTINAKAQAALASLAASDAVGLDPADYRVAMPDLQNVDVGDRPLALLRYELALSAKVLTYVLDATRGRIDPNRLSGYHDLPRKSIDLVDALTETRATHRNCAWGAHHSGAVPDSR